MSDVHAAPTATRCGFDHLASVVAEDDLVRCDAQPRSEGPSKRFEENVVDANLTCGGSLIVDEYEKRVAEHGDRLIAE